MLIKGDIKEPMVFFDKSRAQSSQCHSLSDCAVIGLSGWGSRGVLPYISHIGMCGPKGYDF